MKVVITMAGKGSRFRSVGIEEPKHRIMIDNRPMFAYAMSSLEDFFDCEFVFVVNEAYDDEPFISEQSSQLGIEEYEIIEVEDFTDGQATTAMQAEEYVPDDEEVVIYNIDTYIEEGTLRIDDVRGDGWIPVFQASGERWSFVATEDSQVTAVAEKERISNLATAGLYHFGAWSDFVTAYYKMRKDIKNQYGEVYIAPMYDWLISNSREVYAEQIPSDSVHVLGTPEDLIEFFPAFESRIDG